MDKQLTLFKEKMAEKWITHNGKLWKKKTFKKPTNATELNNNKYAKIIYLTQANTWEEQIAINKKKIRNIKLTTLKNYLDSAKWNLIKAIDLYKELKDKTEYWEKDSTIDFDFNNWNKLKKVNGHITKYLKDLIEIERSINEKN